MASPSDLRSATNDLSEAVDEYLSISQTTPPTTAAPWEEFYETGSSKLAAIRSSYENWVFLVDEAPTEVSDRLTEFKDALLVWIEDQEEQARLSKGCFDLSDSYAAPDVALACFTAQREDHGSRWIASATRVRNALQCPL